MEAASRAERTSLLPTVDEEFALGSTAGAEEVVRAMDGARRERRDGRTKWGLARVATFAATLCLTLGALFVAMNTSGWHGSGSDALALQQLGGVSVTLEVEPVGHVIWLGSKLPNVKRVFLHRNQELLHEAGWKLKLWCASSPCEPARYFYSRPCRELAAFGGVRAASVRGLRTVGSEIVTSRGGCRW